MIMNGALGVLLLILIIIAIIVFALIFWIIMLVDSIKHKYKDKDDKIIWVLVIALLGIIGAIIYYFVVKIEDKKN
jgi:hypothetical protein